MGELVQARRDFLPGSASACGYPSEREPKNEKCGEAIEEESLPRVALAYVRPNEWQGRERGDPIEDVDGILWPISPDEEGHPGDALGSDQDLTDSQAAADAAFEDASLDESEQTPESDRAHKQEHRDREAIMNDQHGVQKFAPRQVKI